MKVSCLGPQGSYSELAAKKLCAGFEIVLCRGFKTAVDLLLRGDVDYAVLPIENTIQGGIAESLDLIGTNEVFVVGETSLQIDHRIATLSGVKYEDVEKIYSHEQALGQCSVYLRRHFPNARLLFSDSTADSLSRLDEKTAGIVGAHIRAEGVTLSEENVADAKKNHTLFVLLERRGKLPQSSNKVYFCAVTEGTTPVLAEFMKILSDNGLSLTRIDGRAAGKSSGEYRFFIECEGDVSAEKTKKALEEIERLAKRYRLLGAF